MEKSIVALVPCRDYDEEKVYEAVKKGIELAGGLGAFVSAEENILVKPNVLSGAEPEKAISTHPAVMGAVLRCLREAGCEKLLYGDSAGNPAADMAKAMEISGLAGAAAKYSVPLADFSEAVQVDYPEGQICKKFSLCKAADDADAIISVCKMKTHALENITGAVKNQYGCVHGVSKTMGHAKYPDSRMFADMLSDLNKYLSPRLYVMDGILAMEGNGPASGNPVFMNLVLASEDPVALDTVFAKLIYLDPANVPTCVSAARAGLGTMNPDNIRVLTPDGELNADEAAAKYGKGDFDVTRKKRRFWKISAFMPKLRKYSDKPVLDASKCIGCGICEDACPVEGKAVHSGNGKKAEYDYSKCIRCYCCQEMCPARAISKSRAK